MEISFPAGCGNSPRIDIVSEFVANWAKGDAAAVAEWLSEDASWVVVGGESHTGPDSSQLTSPPFEAERMEVLSIVTHGRFASCDGYLEAGTARLGFSHVFRFAGAAKTARIVQIRSYRIEMH